MMVWCGLFSVNNMNNIIIAPLSDDDEDDDNRSRIMMANQEEIHMVIHAVEYPVDDVDDVVDDDDDDNNDDDNDDEDEDMDADEDEVEDEVDEDDDEDDEDDDEDDDSDWGRGFFRGDREKRERHRFLCEVESKITNNDHNFISVSFSYDDQYHLMRDPAAAWGSGRIGQAIGRNTRLRIITFKDFNRDIPREYLLHFLNGISRNQSIQIVRLEGWSLVDEEIWSILIRFFNNNGKTKCLEVINKGRVWGFSEIQMVAALKRFRSLKQFKLYNNCSSPATGDVINALIGHAGLEELELRGGVMIGREGGSALATLLQSPRSILSRLTFNPDVAIDDEGARQFANGLEVNATLTEFAMCGVQGLTNIGWGAIFAAFPLSKVEQITLNSINLTDDIAMSLSNALRRQSTILTMLDTNDFSSGIVTIVGWRAIFHFLQEPNSALKILHLNNHSFTDEAVGALANVLVNNSRLRDLDVRNNTDVTNQGWIILAAILRNPNSALERLDISGSSINSGITIAFADALMNNSRLKELYLGQFGSRMTSDGNEAFTHLLCNTSSIIETFQSNHTLTTLSNIEEEDDDEEQGFGLALSDDLTFLLRLNKENTANQAARIKIIQNILVEV